MTIEVCAVRGAGRLQARAAKRNEYCLEMPLMKPEIDKEGAGGRRSGRGHRAARLQNMMSPCVSSVVC